LLRALAAALLGSFFTIAAAPGQSRWIVDTKTSLAWWQVSPNLNHLWATTCPQEPSWRPGENRSAGWHIDPRLKLPSAGYANKDDTIHVPLFPRDTVHAVCSEAVEGQVLLPDTVTWRGVHGNVTVKAEALVTGEAMRDVMVHQLLQAGNYPDIQFLLDSLGSVTKHGDTCVTTAIGTITIRGIHKPIIAAVTAFPDAGGMRVLAKWHFPSWMLLDEIVPKLNSTGLGANTRIWHEFFMGADLVFHQEAMASN